MNRLIDNAFDKGMGWGILVTILLITFVLALAFGVLCFEGWLVMLLWNAAIVSTFGAPTLSFWSSVGILILCNLLFKTVYRNKS